MTISKHIPKRRFKEFVSEDGWVSSKFLDNISQIIDFRGRTPKKLGMDWSKEGYLALSALNVKNGYIDKTIESHFGDEELYNKWMSGKELQKNQVIFTTEAPMGNVAQIPDENKYILSQRTIAFKVNDSKIIDDFLAVLLRSKSTFDSLLSLTSGGTAKGVSQKSLEELSVFIPNNLKEQTFISIFLKKIDTLITLHQHKLDKLKNLKKSYLAELFPAEGERVPKRRFPGFEGEWEVNLLGELGKAQSGVGFPDSEQGGKVGVPFYKVSDMNNTGNEHEMVCANNYVTLEQINQRGWKPINDVPAIFFAKVGAAVLLNRKRLCNVPFLLDNNTMAFSIDTSKIDTNFAKTIFETIDLTALVQIGALPSYNAKDVESISVLIPSKNEQKRIGEFVQKLDKSISLQQQKLDKLKDLKKAYLNELFV